MQLFDRDRRSVALTAAGWALLPRARALIGQADELRRQALGLVVLGAGPDRVCAVVLRGTGFGPTHREHGTGADGHLGHALTCAGGAGRQRRPLDLGDLFGGSTADLESLSLEAPLRQADQLYALSAGQDSAPVDARDLTVLVDSDEASWSSWNRFAEQFAAAWGARVARVDDGGVTG